MIDLGKITFRKLQISDLELMHKWLNAPHVSKWYGKHLRTYRQVLQKYEPRIKGEVRAHPFLMIHAGTPIGYLQTYRISDHPEYNTHVGAEEDPAGVDLFIGEADYLDRGFGTAILRMFVQEVIFSDDSFSHCVIGPDPGNLAAIRCYEKVGFQYFKTIHIPGEPQGEYLMRISREEAGKG